MKIKGVIEDLKIKKCLKKRKRKEKTITQQHQQQQQQKGMIVKIVTIYLGLSLVLLWAVWGQFIFG